MYIIEQFQTFTYNKPKDERLKEKLDPISVLANLALLPFKEKESRLTFWSDYTICIQPPNQIIPQSITRTLAGQSREDLDIIGIAVDKVTIWHKEANCPSYENLFKNAIKGLDTLIDMYTEKKSGLTVAALKYWKILMENGAAEKKQKNDEQNVEDIKFTDDERVKRIWKSNEIGKLDQLLKEIYDTKLQNQKAYNEIQQLELLIMQKQVENQKIWYN